MKIDIIEYGDGVAFKLTEVNNAVVFENDEEDHQLVVCISGRHFVARSIDLEGEEETKEHHIFIDGHREEFPPEVFEQKKEENREKYRQKIERLAAGSLAPCPFCGWDLSEEEDNEPTIIHGDTDRASEYMRVVCPGCDARGPRESTSFSKLWSYQPKKGAIGNWNERADLSDLFSDVRNPPRTGERE